MEDHASETTGNALLRKANIMLVESTGKEHFRNVQKEIQEQAAQIKLDYPDEDSTYQAIQKIPIAPLVSRLFGWQTKEGHFRDPAQGGNKEKACLVFEGTNFLYHGGTDHLPATKMGYAPFELVKAKFEFDNAQTFAWFKEQFPEIAEVSQRERKKKGKRRKKREEEEEVEEAPPEPELPIDLTQFQPMNSQDVQRILGLTVKKDDENKIVTFLVELSAYTENDQGNLILNAPSSTGKSYIPTEIAQLFPQEDIKEIGYCSPQAFFHDNGKYDEARKAYIIDLSRKIVIFLDQPHVTLLERLRPLLSHDKKEIVAKITDRSQKSGMRTKTIILRGFPAVIFCTAGLKMDEQEATRFFLLSPQMDQEKIRDSIRQRIRRESDRAAFTSWLEAQPERLLLRERIRAIRQAHIDEIKIADSPVIESIYIRAGKILKPRHTRDIGRLLSLIKCFALLNFMFRTREGNTIIANQTDIDEALAIWSKLAESQEYNLSPYIYDLYRQVLLPAYEEKNATLVLLHQGMDDAEGLTFQEIFKKHRAVYGRMIAPWLLRQQVLPMLEIAGLVMLEPDPDDKRRKLIFVLPPPSAPESL